MYANTRKSKSREIFEICLKDVQIIRRETSKLALHDNKTQIDVDVSRSSLEFNCTHLIVLLKLEHLP